jgi:uncharacterized membrane protein YkvA (DUF1232 family)
MTKAVQFLKKNWMLIVALLYLFSPMDLVPDVVPILGFSDDVLAIVLSLILRYLKESRERKDSIIEGEIVEG